MALQGKKVVLVDADIGLRNLDVVMGVEDRIVYDLIDVVEGRCRLKQALIKDNHYEYLFLLPSSQTCNNNAVSPEQMKKLCDVLREDFDYVILDCPAGIEKSFKNIIAGVDRALVITTPEVSVMRDTDYAIGLLEASGVPCIDLIINGVIMKKIKRGDMMATEDVVEILAIDLIGVIPNDENVIRALNRGESVVSVTNCLAGKTLSNIARRINGDNIPFLDLSASKSFT